MTDSPLQSTSLSMYSRSRANFITYEYKRTRVFVTPAYDYEVFVSSLASNDFRMMIIDGD